MGVIRTKVKTKYRSSPPFPGKLLCPKNAFYVAIDCLPPVTGRLRESAVKIVPKKFKVHSLTGRITLEMMVKAFKSVKRNRGAAGLDKVSIKMFESNLEENLNSLMKDLKKRSYEPIPLKRVYIPKDRGKFRPLGIPAVRCRVAQEVPMYRD